MDKLCFCIVLCIGQRISVNGQKLVSYNDDVIVTSSSQLGGDNRFSIQSALDGNADTSADVCKCCAATNAQSNPWFKVDLIQDYTIQRVHVIGRTDYPHTLYNMEIELGTTESDGTILQGVDTSDMRLNELDFTLTSPQPARYITLTLRDRAEYFVICELYVYAECEDGTFGFGCEEKCGNCFNGVPCNKVDGSCDSCAAGYEGNSCRNKCEDGTFGLNCEEKCGKCFNCGSCNTVDGSCASCAAGYKGNTCVDECQAGTYGFNCKQRCGMCQDGDVCDIFTGECSYGCSDGYKGSLCSQKIIQNTSSSSDTSISLPVFIGSLFAVFVVNTTIVIGIGWLFYRKRLTKKTHKAANNEETSIPLPNTSSNYDTLRFEHPGGESTYTELNRSS